MTASERLNTHIISSTRNCNDEGEKSGFLTTNHLHLVKLAGEVALMSVKTWPKLKHISKDSKKKTLLSPELTGSAQCHHHSSSWKMRLGRVWATRKSNLTDKAQEGGLWPKGSCWALSESSSTLATESFQLSCDASASLPQALEGSVMNRNYLSTQSMGQEKRKNITNKIRRVTFDR